MKQGLNSGVRKGRRVAVIGALGVAAVALAAGPAAAKSSISVSASAHTAHVGATVQVRGQGGDDSARLELLCLQERTAVKAGHWSDWKSVKCVEGTRNVKAATKVKVTKRGAVQFRSALYKLKSWHDQHPVRDGISAPTTVNVRG
ncbi:hypothetical protein ACIHFE_24630 [Streptomyces sp. NPDC052396]|uniref:hypothetical protein n=1 Tax=Streptomyces sp. NPDC052396 TaxID=3365689 RepID=UPI0037D88CC3